MMTSPENILLRLSPRDEAYVYGLFDELEQRGFPRQHQTPHISLTFAPTLEPRVVELAQQLLPPVIPAEMRRVGFVTFGIKRKQTVAWLLEAPTELEDVAQQLSSANPEGRGGRWVPHLTMGLRLPREVVPDYIRALDELTSPHVKSLTAERAVYWRPAVQLAQVLTP
ncbi:2'-5' RNA ligase family protein [Rothia sp. ZJ932]|nr:2'-5' RNA ligase family protein [Rothia sp. ZJ932]